MYTQETRFIMLKVGGMNVFLPTLQLLYKGVLAKSNYHKHMNLTVLRCGQPRDGFPTFHLSQ
jgi:hypothetical protein